MTSLGSLLHSINQVRLAFHVAEAHGSPQIWGCLLLHQFQIQYLNLEPINSTVKRELAFIHVNNEKKKKHTCKEQFDPRTDALIEVEGEQLLATGDASSSTTSLISILSLTTSISSSYDVGSSVQIIYTD